MTRQEEATFEDAADRLSDALDLIKEKPALLEEGREILLARLKDMGYKPVNVKELL